jgi:hypothetical protein
MDVVVWLRSLGLGKYEGCVDAEDLKELGVAARVQRRREESYGATGYRP